MMLRQNGRGGTTQNKTLADHLVESTGTDEKVASKRKWIVFLLCWILLYLCREFSDVKWWDQRIGLTVH